MSRPDVRRATDDQLELLIEIDRSADPDFRVSGMPVPRLPLSLDRLREAKAVFVHSEPPVGFAWLDEADGLAHLEALEVLPAYARQGRGAALLEASCVWAARKRYLAITLTTFADAPWNASFYAKHGFAEIDEITPDLAEKRDWEYAVGLDRVGRRVVMRREL